MAGDLDRLPGLELGVDSLFGVGQLAPDQPKLVAGLGVLMGDAFELFEPGFQLVDRSFKREPAFA